MVKSQCRPIGVAEADKFAADIRRAINEFLQYAAGAKLTQRKQVRQALLRHKKRAELVPICGRGIRPAGRISSRLSSPLRLLPQRTRSHCQTRSTQSRRPAR